MGLLSLLPFTGKAKGTRHGASDTYGSSSSRPVYVESSRISSWVAAFLKTFLYPIIAFGAPAWPFLAISCFVPVLGFFTAPLFVILTILLMYSIAWTSYLMLAQQDPPASLMSISSPVPESVPCGMMDDGSGKFRAAPQSQQMRTKNYVPFLPYSPMRCLKVNWAALQYAGMLLHVTLPTVFDWSYRRLMVVGASNRNGTFVKENILYGSPFPNKRLDVYIPPEKPGLPNDGKHTQSSAAARAAAEHVRTRKHSTMQFNEPPPARVPAAGLNTSGSGRRQSDATGGAPVIVVLPTIIPPFPWISKRKTYMQLALRLRRMGYCIVVPDITYFPESRIRASVVDVRIVLRWVGEHILHYGGDPNRIHLLGHGLGAHLAMLVVVQEGVVLSREAHLDRAWEREQRREEQEEARQRSARARRYQDTWDEYAEDEHEEDKVRGSATNAEQYEESEARSWQRSSVGSEKLSASSLARLEAELNRQQQKRGATKEPFAERVNFPRTQQGGRGYQDEDDDWVDEDSVMAAGGPPPGVVSLGKERPANSLAFPTSESAGGIFVAAGGKKHARKGKRDQRGAAAGEPADAQYYNEHGLELPQTLAEAEAQITSGLKKVEIYEPQIAVPPLAGVILLAGVADVIKGWRSEMEKGVEHLSFLRRAMGVSHTSCLIHSPAHLLYAAKNIIDTNLLPPKFLLIHGGRDGVVPIEQSTLMKTLLVGVGVEHVKLRCYREMGHVEAMASLFVGMGRGLTKYTKQVAHDIQTFVEL